MNVRITIDFTDVGLEQLVELLTSVAVTAAVAEVERGGDTCVSVLVGNASIEDGIAVAYRFGGLGYTMEELSIREDDVPPAIDLLALNAWVSEVPF